MNDLANALTALYARVPLGMRLGLDPMRAACVRAGNPERAFASVHIGGTNGKGSTCAMVESIARAAGQKTGMYTSPHLCRFAERIRISGEPISDEELTVVLNEALTLGPDLSFFETATLAAFLAFRAAKVDLAIIEVGIGGRLDATNVLDKPLCTAITNVAFDHMDKLGDTLDLIAREKAAIAKAGVPMVLGPMLEEARRAALDMTARERIDIVPLSLATDVIGLEGDHQRANARVAATIATTLKLPSAAVQRGLAEAKWPGRLERINITEGELAGPWILDGAHNPDGARSLVNALKDEPLGAIIFGALEDKSWREMIRIISELNAPRFYVAPAGRAPAKPAEIAALIPGTETSSISTALQQARKQAGSACPVVVCGSLYLVGSARGELLNLARDPIVAL